MERIIFTAAVCAALSVSASANLVVNGDFEISVPSNGTGGNWTSTNVDGSGGWRSTGGNPNGNFILNSNGDPNTNPTLTQAISGLTVGESYTISGDYAAGNVGGGTDLDFGVQIDGNLWEYPVPGNSEGWKHFSDTFVAQNANVVVDLEGERHADHDPRVDNIDLEVASVPEPFPVGIVALGAAGIVYNRRRGPRAI